MGCSLFELTPEMLMIARQRLARLIAASARSALTASSGMSGTLLVKGG
jgi:hypothetical protein